MSWPKLLKKNDTHPKNNSQHRKNSTVCRSFRLQSAPVKKTDVRTKRTMDVARLIALSDKASIIGSRLLPLLLFLLTVLLLLRFSFSFSYSFLFSFSSYSSNTESSFIRSKFLLFSPFFPLSSAKFTFIHTERYRVHGLQTSTGLS